MEMLLCLFFIWFFFVVLLSIERDFFRVLVFIEILVVLVFRGGCCVLMLGSNTIMCYLMTLFLGFCVGEAVMGLGLLVRAARRQSYFQYKSFTILKFV